MDATLRAWEAGSDRRRFALIAGGGITSAHEVYRAIRQGASLVQIYSALIYHGPEVVRQMYSGLVHLLRRDGFATVAAAVGMDGVVKGLWRVRAGC